MFDHAKTTAVNGSLSWMTTRTSDVTMLEMPTPGSLLMTTRLASCLLLATFASAPAADVDFARDVQPLLNRRCVRCHGPKRQESGLRLDVRRRVLQGGDTGPTLG